MARRGVLPRVLLVAPGTGEQRRRRDRGHAALRHGPPRRVHDYSRGDRPRLEHWAAGVLLFTMASAALAAPARASLGIVQVAQSRYASFVLPFWTALCLVGVSRLAPHRVRTVAVPALAASIAAARPADRHRRRLDRQGRPRRHSRPRTRLGRRRRRVARDVAPIGGAHARSVRSAGRRRRSVAGGSTATALADVVAHAAACDATARVVPVPVGSGLRLHADVAACTPARRDPRPHGTQCRPRDARTRRCDAQSLADRIRPRTGARGTRAHPRAAAVDRLCGEWRGSSPMCWSSSAQTAYRSVA